MPPISRYRVKRIAATKGADHKRQKLWQAMRILRAFTVGDLLAVTEQDNKHSVLTYLAQLRTTGFVRAHYGSRRHEPTRYQLIRDSGPQAPALVRRGASVWDQNTETEYAIHQGEPQCRTKKPTGS